MRTRIAHVVVIVIGLLILAYPLTLGAWTDPTCRGVVMRAGDTCPKADNSGVQTYEQRAGDRRRAAPVMIVVGLLVTAFGTSLLVTDVRRHRASASPV